jgi:ATP-binding cassette, subfamily B, bacterial MsbA
MSENQPAPGTEGTSRIEDIHFRPIRLQGNAKRGSGLLRMNGNGNAYSAPSPETPPQLPGFNTPSANVARLDSRQWQTMMPWVEEAELELRDTMKQFALAPRPRVDNDEDISLLSTLTLPAVSVLPPPAMSGKPAEQQPIYASTGLSRRVEKDRIIAEKRLSWKDLRQFSQFVTPFKWQILGAFLLTVGVGLTALPLPFILSTLLDQVFRQHNIPLFVWSLAILLAVFIIEELLKYFNRNVIGILSRSANLNIIYRFYCHMLRLPLVFYQGLSSTGQILSRLNEVNSAQQTVLQMLIDVAVNSILTIIYAGVLFVTDWRLSLAVVAVSPLYMGVSLYFNRRTRQLSRQVLESYAVMNGAMYEGLTGLKTVKALAAEHRFGRRVKKLIMSTNQISFRRTIFQSEANLVIGIVQAICVIAILSFGGYLVLNGAMSAGQLAAYILILRELSTPVSTLNGINQQIQAAAVAIDRLFEILNYPVEANTEKGIEIQQVRGHIMLEHVHFSYTPGIEVLHDINLDIQPGATVAIVGRSGAGKTTISNLLMRFYAPDSGRITIDGYDLKDLKIESLRKQFGVILQDESLFSGTIEDNLTFGLLRKVSYEEMVEAARNANILDFIQSQPLGFKTVLHERGQSLSGGQRQRIAIARMFLRQPRILVMDEPSSALDNESEALIQQALKRLTQGRTTFIIAHRMSTIRDADRIIIIDKGHLVEQGTHNELLALRGVYWHLYNSYGRV